MSEAQRKTHGLRLTASCVVCQTAIRRGPLCGPCLRSLQATFPGLDDGPSVELDLIRWAAHRAYWGKSPRNPRGWR